MIRQQKAKSQKFTRTAKAVLKERYLLCDENHKIIETPQQMFYRVAKYIAKVDATYGYLQDDVKKLSDEFFELMWNLDFLPNSPTLMNSGTQLGQLSACFVLPIEDSIESIFTTLKNMAIIHQSGGGVGYSFSRIRQKGALVRSSKGSASGPVSFMRIYDTATDVIKQGGRRRGANIAILSCNHPDIFEFINAKQDGMLTNFNISVAITDEFMKAVSENKAVKLVSPDTKKTVRIMPARKIFNAIANSAWRSGEPGIIFIDEINRKNLLKTGKIESTNPCGEQPLYPYESCNLGSINLANMAKETTIDWSRLKKAVHLGVHFLDNAIDANKYPMAIIEENTKKNRKIGLGVMGFAHLLIRLRVRYDSEQALKIAEDIMSFITNEARAYSQELAKKRGSFPNFKNSTLCKKFKAMRNATVTTIAPTGTISIIAGVSGGIEPIFAVGFRREILGGKSFNEIDESFKTILKHEGLYSERLVNKAILQGSVLEMQEVPQNIKHIFRTAMNIKPEWHVRMQAAFQKYTDNAISKTVNLPNSATKEDIKKIFMLAYKLKCKGITVYRYASKEKQVLNVCTACENEHHKK